MKITLKELLDAEINVNHNAMGHVICSKCNFMVEAGILVVAWDPPSKAYRLQMWCRHCLKETN